MFPQRQVQLHCRAHKCVIFTGTAFWAKDTHYLKFHSSPIPNIHRGHMDTLIHDKFWRCFAKCLLKYSTATNTMQLTVRAYIWHFGRQSIGAEGCGTCKTCLCCANVAFVLSLLACSRCRLVRYITATSCVSSCKAGICNEITKKKKIIKIIRA